MADDPAADPAADVLQQVAAAFGAVSDDQIDAAVDWFGVHDTLDAVFGEICRRFDPGRAGESAISVQWEIDTPAGLEAYRLAVADSTCTYSSGSPAAADITIGLTVADFFRLLLGHLDALEAFMTGRMRLDGDVLVAQTMLGWFGEGPWLTPEPGT